MRNCPKYAIETMLTMICRRVKGKVIIITGTLSPQQPSQLPPSSNATPRRKQRNRHRPRLSPPICPPRRPRSLHLRLRQHAPRAAQARAQLALPLRRHPHAAIRRGRRRVSQSRSPRRARRLRPARRLLRQRGHQQRQSLLGRRHSRLHEHDAHQHALRLPRRKIRLPRHAQDVGRETVSRRQHHWHGVGGRAQEQCGADGLLGQQGGGDQSDADVCVSACGHGDSVQCCLSWVD